MGTLLALALLGLLGGTCGRRGSLVVSVLIGACRGCALVLGRAEDLVEAAGVVQNSAIIIREKGGGGLDQEVGGGGGS